MARSNMRRMRLDPDQAMRMAFSAFDHPLVKAHGSMANSADRVLLCPPDKPCKACRDRKAAG